MRKKKILMLINFFPPAAGGGVYRPLSFVKYLPGLSWEVTVITPRAGEFWISDPSLEWEIPPEVRVVRTGSLSASRLLNRFSSGSGRNKAARSSGRFEILRKLGELILLPDTYVGWVPFATRAAAELCSEEKFDLVYSTSPPDSTHLAAGRLSGRFEIPWVVDFRDPWIGLYLRDPATPFHRYLHRNMERRAAEADLVVVTTDWQREKLLRLYPSARVEKIPNGYDSGKFERLKGLKPDPGRFTFLHTGMLTLGRKSRNFLEGLSLFMKRTGAGPESLHVIFAGAWESNNREWVDKLGLEEVVDFKGHLPHSECVRQEKKSHVLLLIKHDDLRYRGLIPGKLYEYIGARRPVLAVVPEGEAGEIVRMLNRGETASVSDPQDISEKIEKLYNLYLEGKLEDSYSLEEVPRFSRKAEAEEFNRVLREVIGD